MEKKADVAARLARNSPAIGSKKAPKLYIVPKTTKPTVNATITMIQARRESGRLATDDDECGMDTFTTFLAGGRKGEYEARRSGNTPVRALALFIVIRKPTSGPLPLALATIGKSPHVKSNSLVERAARPWRYGYVT